MELIKELEKRLSKSGITIDKRIWFESKLLPKYYNEAIKYLIREKYQDYIPLGRERNTINYDANGKMYIDVRGTEDSIKLLIYSIDDIRDSAEEEWGYKVSDKEIYILACYLKFLCEDIQDYAIESPRNIEIRERTKNIILKRKNIKTNGCKIYL